MRTIAIIPARKGSKRLPEKNSKLLGGKPLAQWTIDCALKSQIFDDIIFSTDDKNLSEMATSSGCIVPGLRDERLADDTSDLVSVCLDASKKVGLNPSDIIILLQPTSPFRKQSTIQKAFSMLMSDKTAESVVSFSSCKIRPEWIHSVYKDGYVKPLFDFSSLLEQQSRNNYLLPNGLIYAINLENLKKHNNFFTTFTKPFIIDDEVETHDIDDYNDWETALSILKRQVKEITADNDYEDLSALS